jgi:hypothetical protein
MRRRDWRGGSGPGRPTGGTFRRGLSAAATAAIIVTVLTFAVGARPLSHYSPFDSSASPSTALVRKAVIYAKEGSRKLIDGRWNLSQSEAKLGIRLSAGQSKQLMACTGQIVCRTPDIHTEDEDRVGVKVAASAASVLRPDLLVTAKHVFFNGKKAVVPFGSCRFHSFADRKRPIPVLVEPDQRKGYAFNNEDFIVLRLKRPLAGCVPLAVDRHAAGLREGERILSVTAQQVRTLNKLSGREPVLARGRIRRALDGVLGGPPFYYADLDFDVGGSGGAVLALADRRPRFPHASRPHLAPVADDEGRLILRGISVAYGPRAANNRPYSEDRNYTIIIGLEGEFRELVEGKGQSPAASAPAFCPAAAAPKIDVLSEPAAPAEAEALADRADSAASRRAGKERRFTLKNPTDCRICFTYRRCNSYGCWDEAARLGAQSALFAGTGTHAPAIKTPYFCGSGPAIAADPGPPVPARNPAPARIASPAIEAGTPPPPPRKPPQALTAGASASAASQAKFMAAKEKAAREGVHALTSDDISGLTLGQIKALRGY